MRRPVFQICSYTSRQIPKVCLFAYRAVFQVCFFARVPIFQVCFHFTRKDYRTVLQIHLYGSVPLLDACLDIPEVYSHKALHRNPRAFEIRLASGSRRVVSARHNSVLLVAYTVHLTLYAFCERSSANEKRPRPLPENTTLPRFCFASL